MDNFLYHIPTKIHFGRGTVNELPGEVKAYGKRVLLVYGGGSIKKIGLYDSITKHFAEAGIEWYELGGVDPNPRVESVREGVTICREHRIDVVVPVGGGSVIDCAKAVAACTSYEGDAWDMISGMVKVGDVLPVIAVLTVAATGSEMDTSAVISNPESRDKIGFSNAAMRPKVSIMDPEYTYTVSKYQTAAGTADIISHVLEVYFNNNPGAYLQNRFCEAVLKTAVAYGHRAYRDPEDYEARANLMWAGSWAINGLLSKGNPVGWSAHAMEHELSAFYDITHGAGLAVLIPHWLRHMMREENLYNYVEYGVEIWGIDPSLDPHEIAEKAIGATEAYFKEMDLPSTLRELGIDEEYFEEMAAKAGQGLKKAFIPMEKEDVLAIYKAAL